MAEDYPTPGQNEFSADEEKAMRLESRTRSADPARLAQIAPEFAPAAAGEARVDAAERTSRAARRGKGPGFLYDRDK